MSVTPALERTVEAYLTCTVDSGVEPVTGSTGPEGKPRQRCGEFREPLMTVRDARPCRESLSLEREGFVLVNHETQVQDCYDPRELKSVYYPEIEYSAAHEAFFGDSYSISANRRRTIYRANEQVHMQGGCWIFNSWRRHRLALWAGKLCPKQSACIRGVSQLLN